MSTEDAYSILEAIAEIHGCADKLTLVQPSEDEIAAEDTAQEIVAERTERMAPFSFTMCNIPVRATLEFYLNAREATGITCTVAYAVHMALR